LLSIEKARRWAWHQGKLDWKLHSAQKSIYTILRALPKEKREAIVLCARRFGKSYLGTLCALEDALQNDEKQIAIIGPTHKQTRSIVTPLIREITKDMPQGLVTHGKSTSTWHTHNGSTIVLGGFDTVLESLRGLELFSVYLEESGLATADQEEYNYLLYSVIFPTLMHSRGKIIHLTTPPRILGHPLVTETLPKCKMDGAFFSFDIEKNPLLSAEDIEKEIEMLGGRDSITVRRELFCEIIRDEAITILTTFDKARHVAEIDPSHDVVWFVGGDLGYTNDLSVFVLAGYDHNVGKVIVVDEKVFQPSTPSSVIVESLSEWSDKSPTYVVDIQGNTRTDMSGLGLPTVTPIKDKFESTITFIRNEFYKDALIIKPNCKLLIETCENGMFNKQKTDFFRSQSYGHCDAIMALVYLLRSIDKTRDLRPRPKAHEIFRLETESKFVKNIRGLAGR
jgi:hypothetical protein